MSSLLEIPKPTIITAFHETAAALSQGLGDELQNDPFAVQQALLQKLGAKVNSHVLDYTRDDELERKTLSQLDDRSKRETALLVKLERYSLSKFCVDAQHTYMVEGAGLDARYKTGIHFEDPINVEDSADLEDPLPGDIFGEWLSSGYVWAGAEAVIKPHQWFSHASDRNKQLSRFFVDTYGVELHGAPATADDLAAAMNGGALTSTAPELAMLVNDDPLTGGYSPEKKLQVAHELSYLGLKRAAQNISDLLPVGIADLEGEITRISEGPYAGRHLYSEIPVSRLPDETEDNFALRKQSAKAAAQRVFGHKRWPGKWPGTDDDISYLEEALWGVMFKCPVLQTTKEQPISNLQSQQHAALVAVYEYGLFNA